MNVATDPLHGSRQNAAEGEASVIRTAMTTWITLQAITALNYGVGKERRCWWSRKLKTKFKVCKRCNDENEISRISPA